MSDTTIQDIKARIRLEELAQEAGVQLRHEANEFKGPCPFHADKDPSFTIYEADGAQRFKCFGCGASGDPFDFYMKWQGVPMAMAVKDLAARAGIELPERDQQPERRRQTPAGLPAPVSVADGDLERQVSALDRHPEVISFLQDQRRLSPDVIRRARLGYDAQQGRVVIPMLNASGQVERTRLYDWQHKHPGRKMIWGPGTEKPRLYPTWALQERDLLLTAGEMDTLAVWSLGIPAVTGTGGEKTWGKQYTQPLAGKKITICYDVDPEGQEGAQRVAAELVKVAAEVRVLTLPLAWTKKGDDKDLTDWVRAGGTVEQLRELIKAAPILPKPASTEESTDSTPVLDRLPTAPVDDTAVFPERWLVNEKGIFEATSRDGETKFRQIVATPVVITERTRNLDTEVETLRIAILRDGRWRSMSVERDTLADKGRIIRLSARGLLVTSNTSGRLVQFISDYETANLDSIPEKQVVSVSGWRQDPEGEGSLFVAGRHLLGMCDDLA
ncbi:MAG TPA: CHC2 zinc finger domain-containing protein [Symbiobacteriaceae bacterium]|nr:CHC2 zinc finger domain-containing protein [Symbiobacteriaceae bacterium]